MALSATSFLTPQFQDYKSYWLKFYLPGGTTPKPMATDATGGTLIAKAQVKNKGFLETAGGTVFIPFVDGFYDAYLFPTEAAADANDTSSAVRIADNIGGAFPTSLNSIQISFDSFSLMIGSSLLNEFSMVATTGYLSTNKGVGAGSYSKTATVGTAGETDGGSYFIDAYGLKWVLIHDGTVYLEQFGVVADVAAGDLPRTACNASTEIKLVTTKLDSLILNKIIYINRDNLEVDLKNAAVSWTGDYDVYAEFGGLDLDNSRNIGIFYSKGALTGAEETTATVIADGTRVLAVADGTVYAEGDFICLKIKYPRRAPFVRVVARVVEIVANDITLDYTFAWDVTSCTVQPVTVRKNVNIKNFQFTDNSGATVAENEVAGVGFSYAHECNTDNVEATNFAYPAVMLKFVHSCHQFDLRGIRPRIVGGGEGYTLQTNEGIFCTADRLIGEKVRHTYDYTGGGYNTVSRARATKSELSSQFTCHGMYEHDINIFDGEQIQGGNSFSIADSGVNFGEAAKRITIDGGSYSGRIKSQKATDLTLKGGVEFLYGGYETNEIELGCNGTLRIEDVKFPANTLVRARPRQTNAEAIGDIHISRTVMPNEFRFTFHTGRVYIDDCEITKLANSSAPYSKSLKVTGGKVTLLDSWRITTDESVRFDGVDIIQTEGVIDSRIVGEAISVSATDCDFFNGAGFFGSGQVVKSFLLADCKSITPDADATSSQFVMEDTTDSTMIVSGCVLLANDTAVAGSYVVDAVGVSTSNTDATLSISSSYIEGRVRQEPTLPAGIAISNSKFKESELASNFVRELSGTTKTVTTLDEEALLVFTSASAVVITVNASLPVGFEFSYAKPVSTGNVTVALSGGEIVNGNATITATSSVESRTIKKLKKITSTIWQATGAGAMGSSVFITKSIFTNLEVAAGASGNVISIPAPPSGQRVMLEYLVSSGSPETGITVNSGATSIISSATLDDNVGSAGIGAFSIGVRTGAVGDTSPVFSEIDETITVVKDTGTTVNPTKYSYRYGV
tara:strand:- start:2244 stop:5306 length:3063 start_codon:yes stop_codon:yes gene_type:complete